jgi:hypothetical protein
MSDDEPDKRASVDTRPHRRTDLWPVIKANAAPILLILSIFTSIAVTAYRSNEVTDFMTPEMREALRFVVKTVNPEEMAGWRKRQAVQAAQVKATNDLSNRRWCMAQKLAGEADKVSLMECLNERVK